MPDKLSEKWNLCVIQGKLIMKSLPSVVYNIQLSLSKWGEEKGK